MLFLQLEHFTSYLGSSYFKDLKGNKTVFKTTAFFYFPYHHNTRFLFVKGLNFYLVVHFEVNVVIKWFVFYSFIFVLLAFLFLCFLCFFFVFCFFCNGKIHSLTHSLTHPLTDHNHADTVRHDSQV